MAELCTPIPSLHLDSTLGAAYIGEQLTSFADFLAVELLSGNIVAAM